MDIEQAHIRNALHQNLLPSKFQSAFAGQFDAEFVSADLAAGEMTCRFTITDDYLHGGGVVQGGIIASLLDFTMAMLSLAVIEEGELVATTDLHTQFLKPAMPGTFTATAAFTRKGRSAHFSKASIEDASGITVATAIATNMIIAQK